MSSQQIERETPAPILPAETAWPEVSFDIRLGDQVDYIDFDTAAYVDYLREKKLTAYEVDNTSVKFHAAKAKSRLRTAIDGGTPRGRYDPYKHKAHIMVNERSTAEDLSNTLAHETEHYIDDIKGGITSLNVAVNGSSKLIGLIGSPITQGVTIGAGNIYLLATRSPTSELLVFDAAVSVGAIALSLTSSFLYKNNGPERRAYQAGEDAPLLVNIRR